MCRDRFWGNNVQKYHGKSDDGWVLSRISKNRGFSENFARTVKIIFFSENRYLPYVSSTRPCERGWAGLSVVWAWSERGLSGVWARLSVPYLYISWIQPCKRAIQHTWIHTAHIIIGIGTPTTYADHQPPDAAQPTAALHNSQLLLSHSSHRW